MNIYKETRRCMDKQSSIFRKRGINGYYSRTVKSNKVKMKRNVRQLWNEQESHILGGSKREFTLPRGRVLQRLLEVEYL